MTTDASVASRISVGIAGWSYQDWQGPVYPRGTKDKLRFIARYVDVIEINSTFYRPPDTRNVESWVRRTEDLPDLLFTAKVHQDITHRGRIEAPTVAAFRTGFESMLKEGRLRHLLAQFRYDFADTPKTRDHVRHIRDALGDLTNLTLELRHNSWQAPSALHYLDSLGVSVANLDYPLARNSFNLRHCTVGKDAYFRLHGRNTKAWFSKAAGRDETYNYRYSGKELDDIVDRAVEIARMSRTLTLVANNHFQGKEVMNALQIKSMISGDKVSAPSTLVAAYPELRPYVKD